METCSVYLIRAGETDNYKIGISSNLERRIFRLQTGHYEKLSFIMSVEFDTRLIALAIEDSLHLEYEKFNSVGEWFSLNRNQIESIKEILTSEVPENVVLRCKIKELEATVSELTKTLKLNNISIVENSITLTPPTLWSKTELVRGLWGNNVKAGQKLVPKSKVINVLKRSETNALSNTYKLLLKNNYAELRGNKGYFALVDLDVVLQGVQNGKQ